MKYIRRWMEDIIAEALETVPVVVLTGPRQVGKTTLLRSAEKLKGATYFSFDDLRVLAAVRDSPQDFLPDEPLVILDEVQRYHPVLLEIKRIVDMNPGRRFVLSGSANLLLLRDVSESLAGRALHLALSPFSMGERQGEPASLAFLENPRGLKAGPRPGDLDRVLFRGFFPRPMDFEKESQIGLWWKGFLSTYIEKDMRDLANISNLPEFARTVTALGEITGNLLNVLSLSRDTGVPQSTLSRYINMLETLFLFRRIYPLQATKTAGMRKTPKLFCADCGMACALNGFGNSDDMDDKFRGRLFETLVYQLLKAHTDVLGGELFTWRKSRDEVDFVLARGKEKYLFEAKARDGVSTGDVKGIVAARKQLGAVRGFVVSDCPEVQVLGRDIYGIPWWVL